MTETVFLDAVFASVPVPDLESGSCTQIGAETAGELFFSTSWHQQERAKAVCRGCPVRAACLAHALEVEQAMPGLDRHGVVGGMSARERAELSTPVCRDCGTPVEGRRVRCPVDAVTARREYKRAWDRQARLARGGDAA